MPQKELRVVPARIERVPWEKLTQQRVGSAAGTVGELRLWILDARDACRRSRCRALRETPMVGCYATA